MTEHHVDAIAEDGYPRGSGIFLQQFHALVSVIIADIYVIHRNRSCLIPRIAYYPDEELIGINDFHMRAPATQAKSVNGMAGIYGDENHPAVLPLQDFFSLLLCLGLESGGLCPSNV